LDAKRRIPTAELLRERLTVAPVVEALIEDTVPDASATEDEDDVMVVTKTGTGAKVSITVLSILCGLLVGAVVWLLLMGSPFEKKSNAENQDNTSPSTTAVTTAATTAPTTMPTTSPTQAFVDPYATENLVGMHISDIYSKTFNGEMTVKVVDIDYSVSAPKGQILSQYPEPEAMAEKGTVIEVCVSAGSTDFKVADVIGWNSEHALAMLETLGYKVTEIPVYKEGHDYQEVFETDPAPDASAVMGQEIFLYVNYQKPTSSVQTTPTTVD
jgi:hypothetical protein